MYNWILKKDEYVPQKDRDLFIDRNILSMISKISRIKNQRRDSSLLFYRLNPIVKFITTIVLVLAISITNNFYLIILMLAYSLFCLSLVEIYDIKKILLICSIAGLFSSVILIPSIFFGNLFNSISLVIKVISTVMLFNVFSYTTKNQEITKAVKVFGVPDLLILTVDISIKFVTIIGDVAINILNSLKIRSIGRNKKKRHSIQNILGFLFIKSRNYSEDIYSSMLCRGFNGHYRTRNKKNVMQKIDYVYIAVNALLLTGVFIWRH